MADPWASNDIDLSDYMSGGTGLANGLASTASTIGGGSNWNWGNDLSYLIRTGANAWAATKVQQAANGNRYYEGEPIQYSTQQGLVLSPTLILMVGVGVFAFLAAKA